MYGKNPIINPVQKYLLTRKLFFEKIYGNIDNKGTATRKVFIIKANPIQIPKRKI